MEVISSQDRDLLVTASHRLGGDLWLIQGPGGNFSVKDSTSVLIKSSGFCLKDITATHGLTDAKLNPSVFESLSTELQYADAIRGLKTNLKQADPSMELGFHEVIPHKWILHVHSAYGILLGLLEESNIQKIMANLSSVSFHIVEQFMPGLELTLALNASVKSSSGKRRSNELFIMKNHGLIWAGENLDSLQEQITACESLLRTELSPSFKDLQKIPFINEANSSVDFKVWNDFYWSNQDIYPDSVLFFAQADLKVNGTSVEISKDLPANKKKYILDNIFLHGFLSTILNRLQIAPEKYLLKTEIAQGLNQLETEKRRLAQMKSDEEIR